MREQGPERIQVNSDQLAGQLDAYLSNVLFVTGSLLEPASDSFLGRYLSRMSPAVTGDVRAGVIQIALPYFGWYRVALESGGGVRSCCAASGISYGLLGARDTSVYTPGSRVLVYLPPRGRTGVILGAVPTLMASGNFSFSDFVVQGGNTGSRREGYHKQYVTLLSDYGGVENYAHHRPVDQTVLDWGRATETGLWLHVDPQLAFLRASEICGVFVFYEQQALRLAGQRLDVLSAAHTEEYREDEGELTYYRGETPYSWEMLGAQDAQSTVHRQLSDQEVLNTAPYGKLEPLHDDQAPRYRYEEYGGYLGQGRIRQMSAPADTASISRLGDQSFAVGLFREAICLDGEYLVQSARGITFAKRAAIPVPHRQRLQEDRREQADGGEEGQQDYRFAGQYGDGPEHQVGDLVSDDEHKHLISVAAVLDVHAYKFNWKSVHAFHYHSGDFVLQEESETELGKLQDRPDFSQLATKFWLPPPQPKKVKIDERYGEVDIYRVLSFFSLTEDGCLVLTAGDGTSLSLGHGNLTASSPGNILLQSGKSTVILAGDDVVARARNSVDITAGNKDVRVKAEHNLQMLAGNSGQGSLLLECRSEGDSQNYPQSGGEDVQGSGVVIKSPGSRAAILAAGIYLRTGETNGGVQGGPIVLDANKGQEDVFVVAQNVRTFVNQAVVDTFGVERAQGVNHYRQGQSLLQGQLQLGGSLLVKQDVVSGGQVTAKNHFQSRTGGDVGRQPDMSFVDSQIAELTQRQSQERSNSQQSYTGDVDQAFRGQGQVGNAQIERNISFGCRSESQYGTEEFVLPQPYWQQLAGDDTSGLTVWDEPIVRYQPLGTAGGGTETFPYPGKQKWRDEETLLVLPAGQLRLYDAAQGHDVAREDGNTSAYAQKNLGSFEKKKPQQAYYVIDTP